MRNIEKEVFKAWAIAYRKDPRANPSSTPSQKLALLIDNKMSDGQWRTTKAIATELNASLTTVRGIMWSVKDAWGYESIPSRNKGYRKIFED